LPDHECCYHTCPREGTIHIGANGGDSHWICVRHLEKWNAAAATAFSLTAAGLPCEMEGLGELLREGSVAMRRANLLDRRSIVILRLSITTLPFGAVVT